MHAPLDIHLWTWSLATSAAETERLARHLSAAEEARAKRYVSPTHGDHYRVGRGRLREILASATGHAPAALQFATGAAGKPYLIGIADVPAFNLSHTGTHAALAVAHGPVAAVGLDIERLRPIERDIAARFFSASEVAALDAHPAEHRMAAFYRCWTRKEAFIKALGDGFSFPLDAFDVTLDTGTPPAITRIVNRTAAELARWQLVHLPETHFTPDIVGALAVETHVAGQPVQLHWHHGVTV